MASAELRIINRRIKSIKSTKKITRAMELIASSRIVKAQKRLTSSNNYTNLLAQIVEELTGSGEMPSSPASQPKYSWYSYSSSPRRRDVRPWWFDPEKEPRIRFSQDRPDFWRLQSR